MNSGPDNQNFKNRKRKALRILELLPNTEKGVAPNDTFVPYRSCVAVFLESFWFRGGSRISGKRFICIKGMGGSLC